MQNELVVYTWKAGKRRACLVAIPCDEAHYAIGFAVCHKTDTFTRERGRQIAHDRAVTWSHECVAFVYYPHSITPEMERFRIRCAKFFQNKSEAYTPIPKKHQNAKMPYNVPETTRTIQEQFATISGIVFSPTEE
jgi:hypothetical protein